MKICFYAARSGLANNGGTNTIVRTAAALRDRGHHVDICASINTYDRFEHPKCITVFPDFAYEVYDAVCAVSYMDISAMHNDCRNNPEWRVEPPQCLVGPRLYWWMRLWNAEADMGKLASLQKTIVNASWMQRKLLDDGVISLCLPQGTDLDFWHRTKPASTSIGACIRHENRKRFSDAVALRSDGCMLGHKFSFISNKSPEEMRDWYSSLKYFLAPADLEGLPNTPLESSLCGAALICRRNDEAGCRDFADDSCALMYDDISEVPELILTDSPEKRQARVSIIQKNIREKIGTREQCAENLERIFSA